MKKLSQIMGVWLSLVIGFLSGHEVFAETHKKPKHSIMRKNIHPSKVKKRVAIKSQKKPTGRRGKGRKATNKRGKGRKATNNKRGRSAQVYQAPQTPDVKTPEEERLQAIGYEVRYKSDNNNKILLEAAKTLHDLGYPNFDKNHVTAVVYLGKLGMTADAQNVENMYFVIQKVQQSGKIFDYNTGFDEKVFRLGMRLKSLGADFSYEGDLVSTAKGARVLYDAYPDFDQTKYDLFKIYKKYQEPSWGRENYVAGFIIRALSEMQEKKWGVANVEDEISRNPEMKRTLVEEPSIKASWYHRHFGDYNASWEQLEAYSRLREIGYGHASREEVEVAKELMYVRDRYGHDRYRHRAHPIFMADDFEAALAVKRFFGSTSFDNDQINKAWWIQKITHSDIKDLNQWEAMGRLIRLDFVLQGSSQQDLTQKLTIAERITEQKAWDGRGDVVKDEEIFQVARRLYGTGQHITKMNIDEELSRRP